MFHIVEPGVLEAAVALRWRRTRRLTGERSRVHGKGVGDQKKMEAPFRYALKIRIQKKLKKYTLKIHT